MCHWHILKRFYHKDLARKPRPFMAGRNSPPPQRDTGDNLSQTRYTQPMKQTMLLKLAPTDNQHQALLDTMHAFNAACNAVAAQAFAAQVANKFALQKMTYGALRTTYHLPAQLAIRAISKTSE